MSSIFTKLKKFLGKHSGEVADVAGVLGTIAAVLPIDQADKAKIVAVAAKLEKASQSIEDSVKRMTEEKVTFNDADVMRAVGAFLKSPDGKNLIKQAVKEVTPVATQKQIAESVGSKSFGEKA